MDIDSELGEVYAAKIADSLIGRGYGETEMWKARYRAQYDNSVRLEIVLQDVREVLEDEGSPLPGAIGPGSGLSRIAGIVGYSESE